MIGGKSILLSAALVALLSACSQGPTDAEVLQSLGPQEIFQRAEVQLASDEPEEAARLFN